MKRRCTKLQEKYARILKQREKAPEVPLDRFCRQHGISLWTYYHWKKRLADNYAAQRSTPFVPVVIERREPESIAWAEILYPNGILLRCTGNFSTEALASVAGALMVAKS
jgi:hypothetical protein